MESEKIMFPDMPLPALSERDTNGEAAQVASARARLATVLSNEPNTPLLAFALKRLQQASGITPSQMASRLKTTLAGLDKLALCRIPSDDQFIADAEAIARYCDCELSALIRLLRSIQVLATFAQPVATFAPSPSDARSERRDWQLGGALIAARDVDEIIETEETTEGEPSDD